MDNETKREKGKRFSRRDFLKGTAVVGVATMGAASLAGCGKPNDGTQAKAEKNEELRAAFEAAAEPIAPVAVPASWNAETEIIVVGSGAGGMNASIRLAKAGYKVLMLERNNYIGGNSRHSSVFSNFGGHKQAEAAQWAYPSYPYDINNIVTYVMEMQQMNGDPDLLRAMAINGPKCIDWMTDKIGCKWVPGAPSPSGNMLLQWDGAKTKNNGINVNYGTFQYLEEMARSAGVEIKIESPITALVEDGGKCVGVQVTHKSGEVEYYQATRAVVLTAGGMEMNRAMMAKYSPISLKGIANIATPPNGTGECIRMGQGMGADITGLDSTGAFDGGIWWRDYDKYDLMLEAHINKDGNQAVRQPWLRINKHGERVPFLSSSGRSYPFTTDSTPSSEGLADTAAIEMGQPDGKTYVIFDSKFEELLNKNFFGQAICRVCHTIPEDDPFIDRVPEWQRNWRDAFQLLVDGGAVKECQTIEELEEQLALTKGMLTDEVAKWNAACDAGEDYVPVYKYKPEWMIKLDTPPYYGCAVGGHVFGSKTGLAINTNMQVIRTDGTIIEGLYAGWHTAGGSSGEGNPAGRPLTGMYADLGLAFVGGYMCAEGIMQEDGKSDPA